VLASVRRDQVRLLHDNARVTEPVFVEGRDTNGLLEDVFGVPERPQEAQEKVDALFRLLDDERYDEARDALDDLQQMLGPDDSAIVRARWMLDTETRAPETESSARGAKSWISFGSSFVRKRIRCTSSRSKKRSIQSPPD
jgi:hypothetical protein